MAGFCLQSVNMNFMTLDWVCLLIQPRTLRFLDPNDPSLPRVLKQCSPTIQRI